MARVRLLVWLFAALALAMPSMPVCAMQGVASTGMATPCPDHDTGKHAAAPCCCPFMSAAPALIPSSFGVNAEMVVSEYFGAAAASLSGLASTQDPPPPRV
jgi:hypothetical protein